MKKTILFVIFLTIFIRSFSINPDRIDQILAMSLDELLDIEVVTAGKRIQKVSEIPASVTVITKEEIKRYGYKSIYEIFENIPSLYFINTRDFSFITCGIRGYWSGWQRNVIILVDNVEQENSYGLYHMQNINIPVSSIDRIELIRGPMSIMYGSNAFLGAINIITTDDINNSTGFTYSYGSNNSHLYSFDKVFKKDDAFLNLKHGFSYTSGPDESLSKIVSDIQDLEEFGISAENDNLTTKDRLEHSNIYFNLSGKLGNTYANFTSNISEREEYHYWPSFSDGLLSKMHFHTVMFGHEEKLSDNFTIRGTYKYIQSEYWREFDYFIDDLFGQEIDVSRKHKFELNTFYTFTESFKTTSGFSFDYKDKILKLDIRDIAILNTGEYVTDLRNIAFFSQIDYTLSPKYSLIAGFRVEKQLDYDIKFFNNEVDTILYKNFELDETEFLPSIAMIRKLNNNQVIKFLYGRAVKFPISLDVTHQLISGGKDLVPEYIDTYEINYVLDYQNSVSFSASVFQNDMDNLITQYLQFEGENWSPKVSNSGKKRTRGIEFELKTKLKHNFYLDLSSTYQKTKNLDSNLEDITVGYSPNLIAKSKITYNIMDKLQISTTNRYVDKMETLWETEIDSLITSGKRVGDKVKEYFIMDFNALYKYSGNLFFNLKCTNIFDTEFLYPLYTSNRVWADKGMIGDRRKFMFTLSYKI